MKTITLALPIKIKRTVADDGFIIIDANKVEHYFYNNLEYDGNAVPVEDVDHVENVEVQKPHKFNVGCKIRSVGGGGEINIVSIDETGYHAFFDDDLQYFFIGFTAECDYELIDELNPF